MWKHIVEFPFLVRGKEKIKKKNADAEHIHVALGVLLVLDAIEKSCYCTGEHIKTLTRSFLLCAALWCPHLTIHRSCFPSAPHLLFPSSLCLSVACGREALEYLFLFVSFPNEKKGLWVLFKYYSYFSKGVKIQIHLQNKLH